MFYIRICLYQVRGMTTVFIFYVSEFVLFLSRGCVWLLMAMYCTMKIETFDYIVSNRIEMKNMTITKSYFFVVVFGLLLYFNWCPLFPSFLMTYNFGNISIVCIAFLNYNFWSSFKNAWYFKFYIGFFSISSGWIVSIVLHFLCYVTCLILHSLKNNTIL